MPATPAHPTRMALPPASISTNLKIPPLYGADELGVILCQF
jgi:hypothetical protein